MATSDITIVIEGSQGSRFAPASLCKCTKCLSAQVIFGYPQLTQEMISLWSATEQPNTLKGLWNIGVEHCGELRGLVPNRLVPRLPCPFKQCNAYEPFLRVALILDEPPAILGVEAVRHVGFASEGTSFGENQCRNIPSGLKAWLVVVISARSKAFTLCTLLAQSPQYPTFCGSLNWSSFTSFNP